MNTEMLPEATRQAYLAARRVNRPAAAATSAEKKAKAREAEVAWVNSPPVGVSHFPFSWTPKKEAVLAEALDLNMAQLAFELRRFPFR